MAQISAMPLASAPLSGAGTPAAHGINAARATAVEFEAMFLSQLLEHMTAGLKTDGPFGGGHAETVYRSMQNQEFAKAIVRAGGVGIADAVQREILKLQEI